MNQASRHRHYAVAFIAPALALTLRVTLPGLFGKGTPFILFPFAILIAAWIGSLIPGLIATVFSLFLTIRFFLDPSYFTEDQIPATAIRVTLFLLHGIGISLMAFFLKRETERANIETRRAVEASDAARALDQERQEARRIADENESRFRTMADHAPVFVWVSDTDKLCTWVNKPWIDFTGKPLIDQLGHGWTEFLHPDDRSRSFKIYQSAFDARLPLKIEYRLKRHDGVYRWILDNGIPLYSRDDKFQGYIGSAIDITDIKTALDERDQLLRRERTARQEAERSSRIKDEFLATLSHELRTPLNAILGWSQLLRRKPDDIQTRDQAIDTIERNTRAQTLIIEDLLEMSRIISGKIKLAVQPIDLPSIVAAALESIEPAAEARGLRLERLLNASSVPINGDPARIQQVLWNLMTNAVKFTPRGGCVKVTLQQIETHVEIAVSDTGIGIQRDFLPFVFERFKQADPSSRRQYNGLGIGLSIVKHIVELHGGTVAARSDGQNLGATFTILLPCAHARTEIDNQIVPKRAEKNHLHTPFDASALKGVRVLAVDDEPDARILVKRILEDCKAEVTTASCVDEALEHIKTFRPTVIVSDISMPDRDGYDLIGDVRRLPAEQGGKVPAIALTAFARSEDQRRALTAGYQMHLSKPVEPNQLVAAISQMAVEEGQN